MDVQTALVALIVAACTANAVWRLLPAALRRTVAGRLFGRAGAAPAGGCASGCDGCAQNAVNKAAKASQSAQAAETAEGAQGAQGANGAPRRDGSQPLVFHPRPPR